MAIILKQNGVHYIMFINLSRCLLTTVHCVTNKHRLPSEEIDSVDMLVLFQKDNFCNRILAFKRSKCKQAVAGILVNGSSTTCWENSRYM